jgi:F-type H+-transporting ATPase subunit epsilon
MSKQFKLKIITPERLVLEDMVDQVSIPTKEGEITILDQHIPLISSLTKGEILAKSFNEDIPFLVVGGFVEVKNNDGESVRAFKTNALGQFASATQLPNGTYTIGFEDPKGLHTFSAVQVNITGTILPLLEVTSIDAREELRKSLFG